VILPDASVLVYAHRSDLARHAEYRRWLEERLAGEDHFGFSEAVLAGFLRIVTEPRVFSKPTPIGQALRFVETLRAAPTTVPVAPGPRHWQIFQRLCRRPEVRGNLVQGAWFAALAIETGCEWITTDRNYARFPDLRWSHPLAGVD
jgi:uncharacterized protein